MLSAVMPSKLTPAIFARSLWQVAQYCLIVASCASPPGTVGWPPRGAAGVAATGADAGACAAVNALIRAATNTPTAAVRSAGRVEGLVMRRIARQASGER